MPLVFSPPSLATFVHARKRNCDKSDEHMMIHLPFFGKVVS